MTIFEHKETCECGATIIGADNESIFGARQALLDVADSEGWKLLGEPESSALSWTCPTCADSSNRTVYMVIRLSKDACIKSTLHVDEAEQAYGAPRNMPRE